MNFSLCVEWKETHSPDYFKLIIYNYFLFSFWLESHIDFSDEYLNIFSRCKFVDDHLSEIVNFLTGSKKKAKIIFLWIFWLMSNGGLDKNGFTINNLNFIGQVRLTIGKTLYIPQPLHSSKSNQKLNFFLHTQKRFSIFFFFGIPSRFLLQYSIISCNDVMYLSTLKIQFPAFSKPFFFFCYHILRTHPYTNRSFLPLKQLISLVINETTHCENLNDGK